MNKFFTKVASLCVGLAMAAGVGIAVGATKASEVKAADATIDLTAQGFTNQQEVTEVTSGTFKLLFAKASGSNPPKYYTSGTSVRTYANNTLTVSTSGANNITEIVFTLGGTTSATPTANTGTYNSSSKTWTGSAKSITFTNASSGQYHYKTVAITTGGGGEEDPVLQSIAISNEKTAYNVGDDFVKPTVTATYDKGEPQDVTSSATCTGYNMGVAGDYTVTVSYGGKTTTYDITVSDPTPVGDLLYSCSFTDVATHSYTQDKEFTLNSKGWVASVSQVSGGVFYLGCNSTHAAKGVLNNNSNFSDVVSVLSEADSTYGNSVSTAHAYAMRFANAYDSVGSVEFTWAGGNNAFQVYIFGDRGNGLESLAHTDYATSGTSVSGSVKWTASELAEDFTEFVLVARPGASGSTATSKTLRAATFKIFEGESVDPEKETLVVKLNQIQESPQTLNYSQNIGLFYANDSEGEVQATWSSSNTSIFTVTANSSGIATVHAVKGGTANLIASADGYNDGIFVITIDVGEVDEIVITGSMSKTSYTTNDDWSPDGFIVTATYSTNYQEVIPNNNVSWNYNPAKPADGVTSVVATATYSGQSDNSVAQAVTVTVSHAGTAADPFTVVEALAKANEIGTVGNKGQGPWVTRGVISRVTSAPAATYWNATYYISDDGKQANELQVYRGFYLNNAQFDAETALLLVPGATVVVTGNLTGSYGCEYCQGNYLLDIQQPESGDIDVTFAPSITSYEIGAQGTFTASSETSGVTYTWAVDESSVLSVDPSTGDFEALGLGVARVTVTATLNDKQGTAFADITVNGDSYVTVDQAIAIAESLPSGHTTSYYIYVEGFVKEFATSMSSGNEPRAFDISNKAQTKSIMVYTNVNPYEDFISGLSLGDCVRVKANVQNYQGTFELTSPEREYTEKTSISFAYELLSQTDAVCKDYDGVTDNTDDIEAFWDDLNTLFTGLNDAQKADLVDPTSRGCGETVLNAVARYDYLVAKYGLDNFIAGRDPHLTGVHQIADTTIESDSAMIVVVIAAVTSLASIAVLLVIKRRKALIK